jgi:hypothetical protein
MMDEENYCLIIVTKDKKEISLSFKDEKELEAQYVKVLGCLRDGKPVVVSADNVSGVFKNKEVSFVLKSLKGTILRKSMSL